MLTPAVKLIDARETCPSSSTRTTRRARFGGEAKSEMWYVLPQPDAHI
jgi:hypothetical protein